MIWKIKENSIDLNKAFSQGVLDVDINWNEKKWYDTLEKVKSYMDTNDKRPSSTDKDSEIKQLGCWICHQLNKIISNKIIRNSWEEFANIVFWIREEYSL